MDQDEEEQPWDESDEYWASKTGRERIEALEQMRLEACGNDPNLLKVQRVLRICRFPEDEETPLE